MVLPNGVAMLSLSSIKFAAQDPVANDTRLPLVSIGSATAFPRFSPWSFRISLIVNKAAAPVFESLKTKRGVASVSIPPSLAALGYDAVLLVTDAVRRAGSMDRNAVRQALGSTTGFEGVDRIFTYKGPGDNTEQRPYLFELKDGHFARVP